MKRRMFRSRRLRRICKLSFRAKADRTFGHLLRLRHLRDFSADERRQMLVDTLHINLEQTTGYDDLHRWKMPILTNDRRTTNAGPKMCHEFRACQLELPTRIFARLLCDSRVRSVQGGSSWMPCGGTPRCLPEAVALSIFEHHTQGAKFDVALSGAEWWTQFRESSSARNTIKFHWDADEFGLDYHDIGIHPHLSTVTYLTNCGTPTLVLDSRGLEKTNGQSPCGPIKQGMLSYPRAGKHIVFDGQFLHGNVPDNGELGDRVTFLVNIWLNHRPSKCMRLPTHILQYFGTPEAPISLTELAVPQNVVYDPSDLEFQFKVERHVYRYALRVSLPSKCDTAIIKWTCKAELCDR